MNLHDLSEDEQLAQRGGDLVRAAALSVSAPLALRERIEREREQAARPAARRRRRQFGGLLAGALGAAALVVVLATSGGTSSSPTVVQAAALGLRPATAPAPVQDPADSDGVESHEGGVTFPYWNHTVGWRASGTRTDSIGGHHATTVFYSHHGVRVGYTVVAVPALDVPAGHVLAHDFTFLHNDGHAILTWRSHGQTCIITAPSSVSGAELVWLAQHEADEA